MTSGQTVLEKMATNKAGCARKKDLHLDASRAVLFLL
jgi:hypothetical protein